MQFLDRIVHTTVKVSQALENGVNDLVINRAESADGVDPRGQRTDKVNDVRAEKQR